MSQEKKVELKLLTTGIPGLDEVLGGGLPEYSLNLLAGPPGSGKTTMAHQFAFANASADRTAIYFTVIGEPPLKMLRYQQQMAFFDPEKVGKTVRFVDLSALALKGDLGTVIETIQRHVQDTSPAVVIVDSFRPLLRGRPLATVDELELQGFLQTLALYLTSWQATSFLVGEYHETEMHQSPVFTIADGIIWLTQARQRNSIIRKLEVMKSRGCAAIPGLHTFRISSSGVRVFPRTTWETADERELPMTRIPSGVPGLDELLGGGLLEGDATLVAGPSGTGKTIFATQFIAAGIERGETGVLAIFEEHPKDYLARAKCIGFDLQRMVDAGKLRVIYLRPLDLSAEEILYAIQETVTELGAKRLVIDSLNGLELALAPDFREDFRESLYRLMGRLTGKGASILLTIEVTETFEEMRFSPHAVSFLAQNILFLRYVEIAGRLRKVVVIVKMRRSDHSKEMHEIEIGSDGLRIARALTEYEGVLRGTPTLRVREPTTTPGLTDRETEIYESLLGAQESTAAALARTTGFPVDEITSALARLVALNYAIAVVEQQQQTVYRAAERPLGGKQE